MYQFLRAKYVSFTLELYRGSLLVGGVIWALRSKNGYRMGNVFIYFLNVEIYLLCKGVNDTCRAQKLWVGQVSCAVALQLWRANYRSHLS